MKPSSSPVTSSVLSLIKFYEKSKSVNFLKTNNKNLVKSQSYSSYTGQNVWKNDSQDSRDNKNNSIDEFLQLVNKTKKKYKEMIETDIDDEIEIENDNSINKAPETERQLEDNNEINLMITSFKKESLVDSCLKNEVRVNDLTTRCDQLMKEKSLALQECQTVALMSEDQLSKLQDLERTQDLMGVQNLKLREDLLSYKLRNEDLMLSIKDLRCQIFRLKEDKENLSREINNKMSAITNTNYDSKEEYLSPTFVVEELEKTIAFLEKTIGENCKEMLEIKENSKKELRRMEEKHEKEKEDLMSQISSYKADIVSLIHEKHNIDISIDFLREEIRKELEKFKSMKKRELKKEILKVKLAMNSQSSNSPSPYVQKLKQQLEEALDGLKTSKRQNKKLSGEKKELEDLIEGTTKANDELREKFIELQEENLKSSSIIRDMEEESKQIMAKYEKSVSAMSSQQFLLENQCQTIANLEAENAELGEKLESFAGKHVETSSLIDSEKHIRVKISNLEANFQYELENAKRLTSVNNKLKQKLARSEAECADLLKKNEDSCQSNKSLQSKLRSLHSECLTWKNKETKTQDLRKKVEQNLRLSEAEVASLRQNLETANRRIKSLHLDLFLNTELGSDLLSDEDELRGNVHK